MHESECFITPMKSIFAVLALAGGVLISGADLRAARTNPVPVETPSPRYPASLEDTGKSGQAVVEMTITAEGMVENATVKSTDDPAFGAEAMAAVARWRFQAATRDGAAVASKVALPFQFNAPVEQVFNARMGRKVFVALPTDAKIMSIKEYGGDVKAVKTVPARLPEALQGQGIDETIQVRFLVSPEGEVVNPEIIGEVQNPRLVAVALATVAARKYPPMGKDGQQVYVRMSPNLRFTDNPAVPAAGKDAAPKATKS